MCLHPCPVPECRHSIRPLKSPMATAAIGHLQEILRIPRQLLVEAPSLVRFVDQKDDIPISLEPESRMTE